MPNWSGKFECGTCRKAFAAGYQARDDHCLSTGHEPPRNECERCPLYFVNKYWVNRHMAHANHWGYECQTCHQTFKTLGQCNYHERQHSDAYCGGCSQSFGSSHDFEQHLRSCGAIHPLPSCVFCNEEMSSAGSVCSHIESGSCRAAPHLNRDEVYRFVRLKDPDGVISKNMHQSKIYHCPNRKCRRPFRDLADVVNHLESEKCGFIKYHEIRKKLPDIVRGNKWISF
ncbi:hypothetical protein B0T24DRAFT_590631 [Lasiosphaeria ovina]|uniref:C2H2-type domain-containing protein n=1 Tax=Lasiosphaeria ovina TaxID=92902 RepID=A0AAE0TU03_9PEZI|nr:hypothetical protein B0T24DRAFT_590631 [Lasiosphaeria ovina]